MVERSLDLADHRAQLLRALPRQSREGGIRGAQGMRSSSTADRAQLLLVDAQVDDGRRELLNDRGVALVLGRRGSRLKERPVDHLSGFHELLRVPVVLEVLEEGGAKDLGVPAALARGMAHFDLRWRGFLWVIAWPFQKR